MTLPAFDTSWDERKYPKPRILMLEVRDKNQPQGKALGWVVVEREETYQHAPNDQTVSKATICLSYARITADSTQMDLRRLEFQGCYSQYSHAVSLTSTCLWEGAVFLDLPGLEGQRIGTYLMNEVVLWAQQWPEATVQSIKLQRSEAYPENKARRNRFYEQFGLVFDYADRDHAEGKSRPIQAGSLTPVETWRANIVEHRMIEYLGRTLRAERNIQFELQNRARAITKLAAELQHAETHPVRWAVHRLYLQHANTIVATALIALLIAGILWGT